MTLTNIDEKFFNKILENWIELHTHTPHTHYVQTEFSPECKVDLTFKNQSVFKYKYK